MRSRPRLVLSLLTHHALYRICSSACLMFSSSKFVCRSYRVLMGQDSGGWTASLTALFWLWSGWSGAFTSVAGLRLRKSSEWQACQITEGRRSDLHHGRQRDSERRLCRTDREYVHTIGKLVATQWLRLQEASREDCWWTTAGSRSWEEDEPLRNNKHLRFTSKYLFCSR